MQLPLVKNAMDSLKFGKEFYRKYFKLGDDKYNSDIVPGYLKMTVLCLQHCVELFNKKLLMEIDPILIISEESKQDYENEKLAEEAAGYRFRSEGFILSESYNWKTIDYSKSIILMEKYYKLNKQEKRVLNELGNFRNRLTHFGLDVTLDFYMVLITINETIKLILEYYYEKLKGNREIGRYYTKDFEGLISLLEEGVRTEEEAWSVAYGDNFMEINCVFSSLFDQKFDREIKELGFTIDVELGEYSDSAILKMNVYTVEGKLLKALHTFNIPRKDVTVLKEVGEDVILLVIDHGLLLEEQENCYKYFNFKAFNEPLEYSTEFWKAHATRKQGRCEIVNFSEELVKVQIKNYLKKRFKNENRI